MAQIYVNNPRKIIQNKRSIEKKLKIKFSIKDNIATIKAEAEDEYIATAVFEAINLDFKVPDALLLTNGQVLKKISITGSSRRGSLKGTKGRVIGTNGRALETISSISDCKVKLQDSHIGIIGLPEDAENAEEAIKMLINGSKHGHVYKILEEKMAKQIIAGRKQIDEE